MGSYYLLTDLQSTQRKRMDGIGRGLDKLRGKQAKKKEEQAEQTTDEWAGLR